MSTSQFSCVYSTFCTHHRSNTRWPPGSHDILWTRHRQPVASLCPPHPRALWALDLPLPLRAFILGLGLRGVGQRGLVRFALFPEFHTQGSLPSLHLKAPRLQGISKFDTRLWNHLTRRPPHYSRILHFRLSAVVSISLLFSAGRSEVELRRTNNRPDRRATTRRTRQTRLLLRRNYSLGATLFLPGWEVCYVKQSIHKHHEGKYSRLLLQSSAAPGASVLTMQFWQALRRSLKNDREKVNHISITPKSAIAIVPPKKVCSHHPGRPHPRGVC